MCYQFMGLLLIMNLCKLDNESRDICQQPQMRGNGTDSVQRWYFDVDDQLCRAFLYTG